MDVKSLLQDLYFRGSTTDDSTNPSNREESKFNASLKQRLPLDFGTNDTLIRTKQWVSNVQARRKRAKSTDSYFRSPTVCDRLKKSFCLLSCDQKDVIGRRGEISLEKTAQNCLVYEECAIESLSKQFAETTVLSPPSTRRQSESNSVVEMMTETRCATIQRRSRTVSLVLPQSASPQGVATDSLLTIACEKPRKRKSVANALAETGYTSVAGNLELDENRNEVETMKVDEKKDSSAYLFHTGNEINDMHGGKKMVLASIKVEPFRTHNIIPTKEDLLKSPRRKLKPNKVIGSYESVSEYLQTHFDLLLEDFLQPLREGITEYRNKLETCKLPLETSNLKLYSDALIEMAMIHQNRLCISVILDCKYNGKIGEKDFMSGSLVILTRHDFSDMIMGTVVSFENPSLEMPPRVGRNVVYVQLHGESHFKPHLKQGKFILAESKAFFQPYYHVMKIFQRLQPSDFPMEEYIVRSQGKRIMKNPSYLSRDTRYLLGDAEVNVMEDSTWPTAETLGVNESQFVALQTALREKLVVIQGPPGTGKTFLGCKIASTLLRNAAVWNKHRKHPMLIVCQTNHALDQFMEQLILATENLIRVGSQSKSETLAQYNLRQVRIKAQKGLLGKELKSRLTNITKSLPDLKRFQKSVVQGQMEVKRMTSYGIVDLKTFVDFRIIELKHQICFSNSSEFLSWLEEGREFQVSLNKQGKAFLRKEGFVASSRKTLCRMHENPTEDLSGSIRPDNEERKEIMFAVGYVLTLSQLHSSLKKRKQLEESWEHEGCDDWTRGATAQEIQDRIAYFQLRLSQWYDHKQLERETSWCSAECLWKLRPQIRWKLYWLWVSQLQHKIHENLQLIEDELLETVDEYEEKSLFVHLELMRQADVVGMTTSAAARLYPILRELCAPIVIVEEAAEVFEAHVIAAVTRHCQHLILLGDHKQLRPSPASYTMSRQNHIDVSLFERLILNGAVVARVLLTQHRMRPQVSALICPRIYRKLHNHDSTLNRPDIRGMKKNVFFFTHCWEELRNPVTGSFSNHHEADMAIAVVNYLLKQRYDPHDICVLATYRAQVQELEARRSLHPEMAEVRMASVDNFQGEESPVIILSLVRSNPQNQIGFLAIENRACVALSRARNGLYMLGNMDALSKSSSLWSSVCMVLKQERAVGRALPLACTRHPRRHVAATSPRDFLRFSEGGCDVMCLATLQCKHKCPRRCHPGDADHREYRCLKPCERKCVYGHRCPKKCHEDCSYCEVKVMKTLLCGHRTFLDCSMRINEYKCERNTVKTMEPCRHTVEVPCSVPAVSDPFCPVECQTRLKCGHSCPMKCHAGKDIDHSKLQCQVKIAVTKPCGHHFIGKCHEKNQPCRTKVQVNLKSCSHSPVVECGTRKEEIICTAPCEKVLPCGHVCNNKCGQPCSLICMELVPYAVPLNECGHRPLVPCWESMKPLKGELAKLLKDCSGPCTAVLMCGHLCKGNCKTCMHGQLHIACSGTCGRLLICGHRCKATCTLNCPPCTEKCSAKCAHRECDNRCGEPCTPCLERCMRRCKHQSCSRPCGETCDVTPCKYNCSKKLACGHPCRGYCGEPCPPVCLICSPIPGFGLTERLVQLQDCRCVISNELEPKPLYTEVCIFPKEIHALQCPSCHAVVQNTLRYQEQVQQYKTLESQVRDYVIQEVQNSVKLVPHLLQEIRYTTFPKYIKNVPEFDKLNKHLEKLLKCASKSSMHSLRIETVCFITTLFLECVKNVSRAVSIFRNCDKGSVQQLLCVLEQCANQTLNQQQMNELHQLMIGSLSKLGIDSPPAPRKQTNSIRMWRGVWFECSKGHAFPFTQYCSPDDGTKLNPSCCGEAWNILKSGPVNTFYVITG